VFVGTFLLNLYFNEVEGLGPGPVGAVEPSWHCAAVGKYLTRIMVEYQTKLSLPIL
jgi:hypothetical protein